MPLISLILPSFNQASYLVQCIQSIINQNFDDVEIIVMDGGSTDCSKEIIERYCKHFVYWQSKSDGGQANAIHEGILLAKSDWITWLNSDDILLPNALATISRAINKNKGIEVFYGHHYVLNSNDEIVDRYKHPFYCRWVAWHGMPYFAQPGTVFSRELYFRVGGCDRALKYAFDTELWYRFMKEGAPFQLIPSFISGFRIHPESKGSIYSESYKSEQRIVKSRFKINLNGLTGLIARYLLIAMQIFSGNYFSTIAYRIKKGRLLSFSEIEKRKHSNV